jgi:SAM-dependent methyltransferase
VNYVLARDGIAFDLETPRISYGREYFAECMDDESRPTVRNMVRERVELTLRTGARHVLDYGIGAGLFLREIKHRVDRASGFDINPFAIGYLERHGAWLPQPYREDDRIDCVTMWDTIGHLIDPMSVIVALKCADVRNILIMVPVVDDLFDKTWLASEFYQPGERLWYFTAAGLRAMMAPWYVMRKMTNEGCPRGMAAFWFEHYLRIGGENG